MGYSEFFVYDGTVMLDLEYILQFLESHRTSMLSDLQRLVEIESPSDSPVQLDQAFGLLENWMVDLGATVERFSGPEGTHRLYTLDSKSDSPGILILGHIDTVWPVGTLQKRPFEIRDGKAYGPGIYDMKGGIVQTLWALRALRQLNRLSGSIRFLVTCDEEVGSFGSRGLIEGCASSAACVLVIEPPNPGTHSLKTSRKGGGEIHLSVEGRAAHAGNPEKGVNAILELAHQAIVLSNLAAPERGTTISLGTCVGGTKTNVVPAYAELRADLRLTHADEARRVEQALRHMRPIHPQATLLVSGGVQRLPFEQNPKTQGLYTVARRVALALGFDLDEGSAGGMSDGNFTAPISPTLDGLGAVGDGAHAVDEHIVISHLPIRAALFAGLLLELMGMDAIGFQ